LIALADRLVVDPAGVLRGIGLDPDNPANCSLSPDEMLRWVDILEDARDLELRAAPSLTELIVNSGGVAVAVIGLGLSFVGPIGSIVWIGALAIGGLGGAASLLGGASVIRRDFECMERLRAIEQAQEILQGAARER
jgi:hypothetical protein